jgi:hypothetical protein
MPLYEEHFYAVTGVLPLLGQSWYFRDMRLLPLPSDW